MNRQDIESLYSKSNTQRFVQFRGRVTTEFEEMERWGVVVKLGSFNNQTHLINALGAVIKNGDIARARTLVGIEVKDEVTLMAASAALVAMGQPKIKVRITIDCTGSGLNRASYCPSFRQPGFSEALRRVRRGCWMSKGDVSRYFHSFPVSSDV